MAVVRMTWFSPVEDRALRLGFGSTRTLSGVAARVDERVEAGDDHVHEVDLIGEDFQDVVPSGVDEPDDARPIGDLEAPAAEQGYFFLRQRHRVESGGFGVKSCLHDGASASDVVKELAKPSLVPEHSMAMSTGAPPVCWRRSSLNESAVGSRTGPTSSA